VPHAFDHRHSVVMLREKLLKVVVQRQTPSVPVRPLLPLGFRSCVPCRSNIRSRVDPARV
jgi:hypothetical protein